MRLEPSAGGALAALLILLLPAFSGCVGLHRDSEFQIENPRVGDLVEYSNGLRLELVGMGTTVGPDMTDRQALLVHFQRAAEWPPGNSLWIDANKNFVVKEANLDCYAYNLTNGTCDSRYGGVSFLEWGTPWLWGASWFQGHRLRDGDRLAVTRTTGEPCSYHVHVRPDSGSLDLERLDAQCPNADEAPGLAFNRPAKWIRFEAGNPYPMRVVHFWNGEHEEIQQVDLAPGTGTIRVSPTPPEVVEIPVNHDARFASSTRTRSPGTTEPSRESFPFEAALDEAQKRIPAVDEMLRDGTPWVRWAQNHPPARVEVCPPMVSQTTLQEISQWKFVLESRTGRRVGIQVERTVYGDSVSPAYKVTEIEASAGGSAPWPDDGQVWVARDWALEYAQEVLGTQPPRMTQDWHPDRSLGKPGIVLMPSAIPWWGGTSSECQAGTWAGGAYFVMLDSATGAMVAAVSHPSNLERLK